MKPVKSIVVIACVAVLGMGLAVYHYSSKQTQQQQEPAQQPASTQSQTEPQGTAPATELPTPPVSDPLWLPNHRLQTILKDKVDVVFLDSQHGWKMVPGQGATTNEPADIYRTADGGESWVKVATADQNNVSAAESTNLPAGTLPYGGVKNGLSFVNDSTGWITGYVPRVGYQWIFVTNDGGNSWVHQELPVPKDVPGYTSMTFDVTPPAFFTSEDGVLIEEIAEAPQGKAHPTYVFFYTSDGGQHWEEKPAANLSLTVSNSNSQQSSPSISVNVNGTTWQTTDSGYSWTK